MATARLPDPVDLMLLGKFAEAAQAYAVLYSEATSKGNLAIGPDLLMGFHYCIAAVAQQSPGAVGLSSAVEAELKKNNVRVNKHVREDLQVADEMIKEAKKKSERSVARVESEKKRLTDKE